MNKIGPVLKTFLSDRSTLGLRLSIGAGVLLILSAVILSIFLAQSKRNAQISANDQSILESRGSDPQIKRVSLPEAKTAFDNQQALFLDVRGSASYAAGHIPGAINIPLAQILDDYHRLELVALDHPLLHLTGRTIQRPCGGTFTKPWFQACERPAGRFRGLAIR